MTPADVKIVWPTSCEIARAVFAACGSQADAIDVIQGHGDSRARIYAFVAVAHQFPTAPRAALGRKFGDERVAAKIRSGWAGTQRWFDIARLNAVRQALGWSPITEREAIDAPLLYCGRSWEEFVDRGPVEEAAPLASPDVVQPEAGGGSDEPPALILDEPQPEPKSEPVCQPKPAPAPPAPKPQRVTPPALVTKPVERELKGAPRPGGSKALFAPSPKEPRAEIPDTRRPQNELQGRLLNESLRGVTSFRPDPPAEKRGAVNVTADLMGDPPPGRREMLEKQRQSEINRFSGGGEWP